MARKYHHENLIPALRLFIKARNEAVQIGFTDNGGAIHSAERIHDILCVSVCYPHLAHINDLKRDPDATISVEAHAARERGESLLIEHVLPKRAFTREVIELVGNGATNEQLLAFIKDRFRLVLLTKDETTALNRHNRSSITPNRIADAGIKLYKR
jgi:hypothetical protein